MRPFLLDVNVMVALAWPTHVAHRRALDWFGEHSHQGWATCPITEAAFVRILSNPAFSPDALTPQEALAVLVANFKHSGHRFWRDELPFPDAAKNVLLNLTGHKQVTDAYLVGLALHNNGKLATLDAGLVALAGGAQARTLIELI